MTNADEIEKAISVHERWKAHLDAAIHMGKMDEPVESIRQDNQCDFGKWLYGPTFTFMDAAASHYGTVKTLHAEFHKTAARVVELASGGKKAEAEKMMANGGEYAEISGRLLQAMTEWKGRFLETD